MYLSHVYIPFRPRQSGSSTGLCIATLQFVYARPFNGCATEGTFGEYLIVYRDTLRYTVFKGTTYTRLSRPVRV